MLFSLLFIALVFWFIVALVRTIGKNKRDRLELELRLKEADRRPG